MHIWDRITLKEIENMGQQFQKFKEIMKKFSDKRVLVLGDFCLDEYLFGDMTTISPEAPIPRIIIKEKKYIPGAAGNVVCGVRALHASAYAVGVIGKDANGIALLQELQKKGINTEGMIAAEKRSTPTYSRVVCGGVHCPKQQVMRFDIENNEKIEKEIKEKIKQHILNKIAEIDAIIVADYDELDGFGIVSEELMQEIVKKAKEYHVIIIGDSRRNLSAFKGFTAVVPNDIEAGLAVGRKLESEQAVLEAGETLQRILELEAAIITRGKDGISVFEKGRIMHHPTIAKEVFDVTGAGDTVTCLITLARASGLSYSDAAILANYGASITVSKEGTVAVTREEIEEKIQKQEAVHIAKKHKTRGEIKEIVHQIKSEGKKIVFLNGYFDPIHIGHMQLLHAAKEYGDILIVGVNTDESVRTNKGPNRPFMKQEKRVQLLSSIDAVDYIVLYDELTPIKLIQEIRPTILAKGNNYTKEEVVGKEIVEAYGGEVILLDMIQGLSSEVILEAMKYR